MILRVWLILFALTIVSLPSTAMAAVHNDTAYANKVLNLMEGSWYDHDGNLVLKIHDGYINLDKVTALYDLAGSTSMGQGDFRVKKSTGERKLYLEWKIRGQASDFIKVNDETTLHRSKFPLYSESIAGIHLGMTSTEVRRVLGSPSSDEDGWYYEKSGMKITFNGDSVDRIILYKGSREVLKKSGLNCSNTPKEFYEYYHFSQVPDVSVKPGYTADDTLAIGKGEYLSFAPGMEYIMLTIYGF